ncbi:MAG: prepilin peptidase [bacterium]|nr:prepilin peptidase [bacterium]
MEYIILFSLFIFGLIIGSFLNVVILRWNTGMSISRGRSKCFSCDKTLSWYELIPLFSFIVQLGKCRVCGSKISLQYPLVELATGILLLTTFIIISDSFAIFVLTAIVICLYIVIFVYDLRHKIIPDFFSYTAALIALVIIALEWQSSGILDLWKIVAGPSLFLFFYFFWFISRGRWMGFGDAKLALSIGWLLGMWQGIAAILLSFWIGAFFSLLLIFVQGMSQNGGLSLKSEIPFGPFILIGFFIVFVFHIDIQSILYFLAV